MTTEVVKDVGGMPTKCASVERDIEGDLTNVNFLVLIIPGNPGIVDFYYEFMTHLSSLFKERYANEVVPIWAVSHAGHQTEEEEELPLISDNPSLYTLDGQVLHKSKFIDLFVPAHVRIILIGHSIGCYIGQELIKSKSQFSAQVVQFVLLFPTIMDMKNSPNGKFYVSTQSFHWLLLSALFTADLLPDFLRRSVVNFYLWFLYPSAPSETNEAILTLIQKETFEKVLAMADTEMTQVCDLDVTFLQNNEERLFLYFGGSDGWCPMEFVQSITTCVPKVLHTCCQEGIAHAFVLDNSCRMAEILAEQINLSS